MLYNPRPVAPCHYLSRFLFLTLALLVSVICFSTSTLAALPAGFVNNTDTGITYTGSGWQYYSNRGLGDVFDDVHATSTNGDSFSYSFASAGIGYVTETSPDEGNVQVYLDGVLQATVNCYSATRQVQQTMWSITGLSGGSHTLTVMKQDGAYMVLDALIGIAPTLGEVHFYPRDGYGARMTGGKFQGSSDNTTYTDLFTITTQPTNTQYTIVPLSVNPRTYRYLRYLSPPGSNDDVAEIAFYMGTGANAVKLTGTGFGTPGSYGNSGNDFTKALDGNAGTFFDAPNLDGNFVGIDQGVAAASTGEVHFYPRPGFASRMTGGKFQGSADNRTYTDLYTIATQPADGQYTTVPLTANPNTYRYLRYLGPPGSCANVSEIAFYMGTGANSVKLTGTGFGTPGSYGNSGNDFTKALDGSTGTFFDSPIGTGSFVGIDTVGFDTFFGQSFVPVHGPDGPKAMQHWQVSCIGYGGANTGASGSVSGYVQAITEAKGMGCDGFGLDCGADTSEYLTSLKNLYAAADQINAAAGWGSGQTGTYNAQGVGKFSLYVKIDFSEPTGTFETTAHILNLLTPVLFDSANWTIGGRPVWATYVGGNNSWASYQNIYWPAQTRLTQNGVKPYLIWGGAINNSNGSTLDGSDAALLTALTGGVKSVADAVWRYPNPTPPVGPLTSIPEAERLARLCAQAGLGFQASFVPAYGQINNRIDVPMPGPRYLVNYSGGEGASAEYHSVNAVQKPVAASGQLGPAGFLGVEIATANDLDELSNILAGGPYMGGGLTPDPSQPVWVGYKHSGDQDWYQSKLGLQQDLLYGTQGMKTDVIPKITLFRVNIYQLTSLQAALQASSLTTTDPKYGPIYAENDDTGGTNPGLSPNYVYTTVYAPQSCTVRLTQDNGYTVSKFVAASSVPVFVRLPCQTGSVTVTIEQAGKILVTVAGHNIAATVVKANPNIYSATASQ